MCHDINWNTCVNSDPGEVELVEGEGKGEGGNEDEDENEVDNDIKATKLLQFDFATIRFATNNFSDGNKLGQGGFGAVYRV